MRLAVILSMLCALVACGADGEPERPDRAATGVGLSGSVSVGITGGQ